MDRHYFYGLIDRDFRKTTSDVGTVRVEHDINSQLTIRNTTRDTKSTQNYIWTQPDDSQGNVVNGMVWRRAKLPAGDMVLYAASSLHHVSPITRGVRIASFFWIQSMVRDDGERTMLFQLDNDVQRLAAEKGSNDPTVVSLTGIYHNLLRRWADA
ncbi:PKHD-type hydroxylase YbiX [Paraburkholderia ultramafica]|uniref:PKHD-type hydroxylase YbiX n=1 Tax=Paraburkholderia ultramafica TaxID=1544867 RepID=A0A6S7B1F3_9BURK|nr:PKHD-type hydroxylase YbiX [Paraburkholderia ultramafica]